MHQADKHSSGANVLRAVFAGISLGFFNLIFMIPVFAVVLSVLASFYAVSLSLIIAGLLSSLAAVLSPVIPWLSMPPVSPAIIAFAAISIASLGMLIGLGMIQLTKWCLELTAGYIKSNINLVSNKERESDSNV